MVNNRTESVSYGPIQTWEASNDTILIPAVDTCSSSLQHSKRSLILPVHPNRRTVTSSPRGCIHTDCRLQVPTELRRSLIFGFIDRQDKERSFAEVTPKSIIALSEMMLIASVPPFRVCFRFHQRRYMNMNEENDGILFI